MTTDTPRADAVPPEFDGITNNHVIRALRIFGREKMTKDGSLESWINLGADRLEKAEAEVERLRSQLNRAVEVAETACRYLDQGGWNEDELYSGAEGWVTETEINEVCATLAKLKSEIK